MHLPALLLKVQKNFAKAGQTEIFKNFVNIELREAEPRLGTKLFDLEDQNIWDCSTII